MGSEILTISQMMPVAAGGPWSTLGEEYSSTVSLGPVTQPLDAPQNHPGSFSNASMFGSYT